MADLFTEQREKSLSLYKDRRYNGHPVRFTMRLTNYVSVVV